MSLNQPHTFETIIVGGGQAGLSTSYYLGQLGREHVVFEQAALPAHAWRNQRWDSFTLVTPNWTIRLPGAAYQADQPDGFMPRQEIIAYFEDYIERFKLPVLNNTRVTSIEKNDAGYRVSTLGEPYRAKNVVVATGSYQFGKIPPCGKDLSTSVRQLHASEYRNPESLPPGAVLVVDEKEHGWVSVLCGL